MVGNQVLANQNIVDTCLLLPTGNCLKPLSQSTDTTIGFSACNSLPYLTKANKVQHCRCL